MKWEMVRLGDVCEINVGKTPPRERQEYFGKGMPWVSIADMNNKVFIDRTKEEVTETGIRAANMKIVQPNTVLFSFKLSVGKVNITSGALYTNEAIAAFPILDDQQLFTKFLYYALQVQNFALMSERAAKGITLNKAKLNTIKIPLLPFPIQQKIAAILDAADALRRKDKALTARYDALLQSTFHQMFGDPVKNEMKWEVKKLGDISSARLGKMLDIGKFTGKPLKSYLGNSNVQWHEFQLENLKKMEFGEKDLQTYNLERGDILMCEGGEIGRCAVWMNEMTDVYFQKALHRIRLYKNEVNNEYFVWLMKVYAERGGFKNFSTMATIAHLTGEKLKHLGIPLPPLPLQTRFAEIAHNIQHQKAIIKQQGAESEALFQGLLHMNFKNKQSG